MEFSQPAHSQPEQSAARQRAQPQEEALSLGDTVLTGKKGHNDEPMSSDREKAKPTRGLLGGSRQEKKGTLGLWKRLEDG